MDWNVPSGRIFFVFYWPARTVSACVPFWPRRSNAQVNAD